MNELDRRRRPGVNGREEDNEVDVHDDFDDPPASSFDARAARAGAKSGLAVMRRSVSSPSLTLEGCAVHTGHVVGGCNNSRQQSTTGIALTRQQKLKAALQQLKDRTKQRLRDRSDQTHEGQTNSVTLAPRIMAKPMQGASIDAIANNGNLCKIEVDTDTSDAPVDTFQALVRSHQPSTPEEDMTRNISNESPTAVDDILQYYDYEPSISRSDNYEHRTPLSAEDVFVPFLEQNGTAQFASRVYAAGANVELELVESRSNSPCEWKAGKELDRAGVGAELASDDKLFAKIEKILDSRPGETALTLVEAAQLLELIVEQEQPQSAEAVDEKKPRSLLKRGNQSRLDLTRLPKEEDNVSACTPQLSACEGCGPAITLEGIIDTLEDFINGSTEGAEFDDGDGDGMKYRVRRARRDSFDERRHPRRRSRRELRRHCLPVRSTSLESDRSQREYQVSFCPGTVYRCAPTELDDLEIEAMFSSSLA